MPPAWPDHEYLTLLGQVVYSVASLEGLLLFDLPRMPDPPPGANPADLAGKTTTELGKALASLTGAIDDENWSRYIDRGGEALTDLGPFRNSVLHARPASVDGKQQLRRWRLGNNAEVFTVTREHLEGVLDRIEEHRVSLNKLRPPL